MLFRPRDGSLENRRKVCHEFVHGSHEIRTLSPWALRLDEILGRAFSPTTGARLCEPPPAAFHAAIEPPVADASVILLPAGSLFEAAGAAGLPALSGTPRFAWPAAAAGSTARSMRLDAIVFGSRQPMYLALVVELADENPARERKSTPDTPAQADAKPLDVRVAAWPLYPAMAEPHVAAIASRMPETRFLPAAVAPALAGSVDFTIEAQSAQPAPVANVAAAAPAAPQFRMPVLQVALADETSGRLPALPSPAAGLSRGLAAEAVERMVRPLAAAAPSFAATLTAPALGVSAIAVSARPAAGASWTRIPAAEPAARFVAPAMAAAAAFPSAAPPRTWRLAISLPQEPAAATWMRSPVAEPAARWVEPVVASAIATTFPLAAPRFGSLAPAPPEEPATETTAPAALLGAAAVPAAEPAARWVEPAVASAIAIPLPLAAPRIDSLGLKRMPLLGAAPVPAAEPAARWVEPAAASAIATPLPLAAPRIDALALASLEEPVVEPAAPAPTLGAVSSPAAEPAARWIEPAVASAIAIPLPLAAPRIDSLGLKRTPLLGAAPVPAAEPAARWVEFAVASAIATPLPLAAPRIDSLTLASLEEPVVEPAAPAPTLGAVSSPAAEPAARWIEPAVASAIATPLPLAAPRIDALALTPLYEPAAVLGAVPSPAAEPAARWIEPAVASAIATPLPIAAPRIDALALTPLYEPAAVLGVAPLPAAEPAERMVFAAAAVEALFATLEPAMPQPALAVAAPDLPFIVNWMPPAEAELVAKEVRSNWLAGPIAFPAALALPEAIAVAGVATTGTGAVEGDAAEPLESMPEFPGFLAQPVAPETRVLASAPVIPFPVRPEFGARPFQPLTPAAYQSEHAAPNGGARLTPISSLKVRVPAAQPIGRTASIPQPGLAPMEFFCQRLRSVPVTRLSWLAGTIEPRILPFSIRPTQEKLDEIRKAEAKPKPEPAKVQTLPTTRLRANTLGLDRTAKIAACLLVAAFLWLGFRSNGFTTSTNPNRGSIGSANDVSNMTASARRVGQAMPAAATGTMSRIRRAIADRASIEMTDSFRNGMENWGAVTKAWAQGWSRHADGYVRTGELALFSPSTSFKNYRLEFYGQIESKAMGWVVRAKDRQNYYAMKFQVIEPGMRPIVALVTYTVVGGKHGKPVTTPLSTMMHNRQAYHVAVDVRGSRFTTSIEGEQVGSFTDNTLASGGIGFFSESGERARLYWMKVAKNPDFLGRICSMLAGDDAGAGNTAEVWGPEPPPQKRIPAPYRPEVAMLPPNQTEYSNFSPERAKISKQEKNRQWTS